MLSHTPSLPGLRYRLQAIVPYIKVISGDGISDAHKRVGSCLQRMSPPAYVWREGPAADKFSLARMQDVVGGTKRAVGERSSAAGKLPPAKRPEE